MDRTIKLLLDKVQAFEKQNEKLKAEILTLTNEKIIAEKKVQQYNETFQAYKTVLSEVEAKMKENDQEINRLRKLKWHQKLFGKK